MQHDLIGLAERCEAASGPDRNLDAMIHHCIHDGIGTGYRVDAPAYSSSLDAAMTLVDPKALWSHGSMEEGPFARLCWPMPNGSFVGGYFEAKAATVPLATCAAALRARSQIGGSHGE